MKRIRTNIKHSGHSRKRFLNALSGISLVLFLTLLGCSKPENRLIAEFYNPEGAYKVVAFERIVKDSTTLEMSVFPYQKEINKRDKGNIFSARIDETVEIEDVFVDWDGNKWGDIIVPEDLKIIEVLHDSLVYVDQFAFSFCKCLRGEELRAEEIINWKNELIADYLPFPPPPPSNEPKIVVEIDKRIPEFLVKVKKMNGQVYVNRSCYKYPRIEWVNHKDNLIGHYYNYLADSGHRLRGTSINKVLSSSDSLFVYETSRYRHYPPKKAITSQVAIKINEDNSYTMLFTENQDTLIYGDYIDLDAIENYSFDRACKSSIKK